MLAGGGPVTVADHELVAVLDVLDGVVVRLAVVAGGVERGVVFGVAVVPLRRGACFPTAVEGDGELALGIVLAEENLRDGRAALLAGIVEVEQGGDFIDPAAHVHAAAAGEEHDGAGIGSDHLLDERVLAGGQREGAVVALALGFGVESDGDDHHVSLRDGFLFVVAVGHGGAVEDVRIGAEKVGDAGEDADRLKGMRLRRTAAARDGRISVGADDGDVFDLRRIERQKFAFVLEQRDALKGFLKRERAIGDRVGGVGGIELRARGESVAQLGAQQAQHMLVDGGFFHLAGLHRGNEVLRVHEFGAGHLEIETVVAGGDAVVGRVPVGHENALESPLALEHLEIEEVVLRGVDAVDQVVGVHDGVDVGLGDGGFEGGQIDFAHGALVHVGAGVVAIELLVVEGVVLDGGNDALGLHAFNERNHQRGVEERILRQVLEVAAVDTASGRC